MFAVLPQQNHTLVVTGIRPKGRGPSATQFHRGEKIDGTLSVSVANGVKTLKHNAESEPTFFGLFGSYKWQIRSPAADPMIVVQLS